MKIGFLNNINSPNFESKRLYKAKLYWHSKKDDSIVPEDVYISQINYDDIENLSNAENEKILENWGEDIINKMSEMEKGTYELGDTRFYAIEAPKKDGIKIRALAMVSGEKDNDTTYLNYLQSYNSTNSWHIHGAGSCLIYGIIDSFARKNGSASLSLDSAEKAREFYKKTGFKTNFTNYDFGIKKRNFKKIKHVLRQKYSIKKIKEEE